MKQTIKLTESDLYRIVNKVLLNNESNKKLTFTEKLDELLEFHIKLYKASFISDGNHYLLEQNKTEYIKNLFPNNNNVIKEYKEKFNNPLLVESLDIDYVDNFFGFIRNNFIKQSKTEFDLIGEQSFVDSAWNAAKTAGNAVVSGAKYVANKIGEGFNWLKKNGLGWLMGKFREFLDSGWGQAAQLFLDSFGVGAIANVVIWGLMTVWDLLNQNWGLFLLSALSVLTAGALAPFIGRLAKNFKGITGGLTKALEFLKSTSLGKSLVKWIPNIKAGVGKIGTYIGQGVEWLISKFGKYLPSNWVSSLRSGVTKAVGWVKNVANDIMGFASKGVGEKVSTDILKKFNNFPGLQKLLTNPKWSNTLKGLDAATSKLVDDYITSNARKYSWSQIEGGICRSMKPIACNAIKKVGIAYSLKREGGEAIHKGKESFTNIKNTNTLLRKRDKLKNLRQASGNVTTAINKGAEAYEKERELSGAEG